MNKPQDVSRRTFLTGAAGAGAMAAAAATLGISSIASAEGEGGGTTDGISASGIGALALPPIIPGAKVVALNLADIIALSSGATTTCQLTFGGLGVYNPTGWMDVPLQVPVGARLLRVDSYSSVSTSAAAVSFNLNRSVIGSSNFNIATISTPSALGIGQATYAPVTPYTVGAGERLYLETLVCNSTDKEWAGAIYQYFDPNPQLNLLSAPIRVYDSRPATLPAVGTKAPLANNAQRVIDCTTNSAIPAGAAAAMINLTITGTSAGGYMALWKNGIPYPGTSSVNWDHAGTNAAVTTVVALDATAKFLALTAPNASTDFIVDVIGYYA
jgi:hypothetical protein